MIKLKPKKMDNRHFTHHKCKKYWKNALTMETRSVIVRNANVWEEIVKVLNCRNKRKETQFNSFNLWRKEWWSFR